MPPSLPKTSTSKRLSNDFPFLLKVIDFRLSLIGFSKDQRKKYAPLWLAKEREIAAAKNSRELKKEREAYLVQLKSYGMDPAIAAKRASMHISAFARQDWQKFTECSNGRLKTREDQQKVLEELESWIGETEDEALAPFIFSAIESAIPLGRRADMGIRFFDYYGNKRALQLLYVFEKNTWTQMQVSAQQGIASTMSIQGMISSRAAQAPTERWNSKNYPPGGTKKHSLVFFLVAVLMVGSAVGLPAFAFFTRDPTLLQWGALGSASVLLMVVGCGFSLLGAGYSGALVQKEDWRYLNDFYLIADSLLEEVINQPVTSMEAASLPPAYLPRIRFTLSRHPALQRRVPVDQKRETPLRSQLIIPSGSSPTSPAPLSTRVVRVQPSGSVGRALEEVPRPSP